MKVAVDADVCAGHGVCFGLCPEVFELHDDGYSFVKVDEVPVEHEAAVRQAVVQCPTQAITITEPRPVDRTEYGSRATVGRAGPRVAPIPPKEWPPTMRDALGALRVENPRHPFPKQEPGRPKGLNLLGLLAHHPDLTRAYHTFNGHVLFGTTLSPRQRELLVLRVGVVRRAEYEYAQHVILGLEAGLTNDEIDRITEGPAAAGWSPVERALLAAVDELLADACIGDETWAVLSGELDTQQLMDLVFTVGAYELLAMAMRTFGVEIDDDLRNWKRPSH